MIIVIDRHNGIPAYRQVIDQLRLQIASGVLTPGDELPSTRALARELGLNPMTISKAYSALEKEGALEHRPGRALLVRALAEDDSGERRVEELERGLESAVTLVHQLQVDPTDAVRLFERLLKQQRRRKHDGKRVHRDSTDA